MKGLPRFFCEHCSAFEPTGYQVSVLLFSFEKCEKFMNNGNVEVSFKKKSFTFAGIKFVKMISVLVIECSTRWDS